MMVYFESDELEQLYRTPVSQLRGKQKYPMSIIHQYKKAVLLLSSLARLDDLRMLKGYRFGYLKGGRKGQCSMRLNDQYRLIITPTKEGTVQIVMINEISKHYE